jgi:hypothetical protein
VSADALTGSRAATRGLVTEALAREAVACARPLFERAVQTHDFGESNAAHAVVMRPGSRPGGMSFEEAILYEESFGDVARWDADYAGFARAKAKVAWCAQLDSQKVRDAAPQLLATGDTLLGGGVHIDGMTIAVSGMQAWFDEALAASVAWFLRALAKREVARRGGALHV